MRLLSVDFDYFFPIPNDKNMVFYDWGHKETIKFMQEGIWQIRAAGFLRNNMELPKITGLEKMFWNRFKFSPNTNLYISDSHSQIYRVSNKNKLRECWNFDAHHDAYESEISLAHNGRVDCQNWATAFHMAGIKLSQFYPEWETDWDKEKPMVPIKSQIDNNNVFKNVFKRPFDAVFVCRSSAWVPSWIEDSFWQFLDNCPIKTRVNLDNMKPREFDMLQAQNMVEQEKLLMANI